MFENEQREEMNIDYPCTNMKMVFTIIKTVEMVLWWENYYRKTLAFDCCESYNKPWVSASLSIFQSICLFVCQAVMNSKKVIELVENGQKSWRENLKEE